MTQADKLTWVSNGGLRILPRLDGQTGEPRRKPRRAAAARSKARIGRAATELTMRW